MPSKVRRARSPGLRGRIAAVLPGSRGARLANAVRCVIAEAEASGLSHLVISDENSLGRLSDLGRGGPVYPRTARRLARLASPYTGKAWATEMETRSE